MAIFAVVSFLPAAPPPAGVPTQLRSPGFTPSGVRADGALVEPWGVIRLDLVEPRGATIVEHRAECRLFPAVVTVSVAGPIRVARTAYRAPIWPAGVDVIEAAVTNTSDTPARARLELATPERMELGEMLGVIAGKASLALPAGIATGRERRPWGCATATPPRPHWARPGTRCDPAFGSIRAGLGGIPIRYEVALEPGASRTVALGFCESHHDAPGQRVMTVAVEGTPARTLDPIESWGRHRPGALVFAGRDLDRDGRLRIEVAPHSRSADRNPILNVVWIFNTGHAVDTAALVAGKLNAAAKLKIDVGGEQDQSLYPPGKVAYALTLKPGETRTLLLLARSPDAPGVPDPETMRWTAATLRGAAADVWRDRWTKE